MKTSFFYTILWMLPLCAISQKAPIKFGNVPIDELKMTTYDKDSSAAAVVLADFGESTIRYVQNSGFVLEFDRITRIKILKKEGFDWADFSVPLYHEGSADEKISGLKGVTYNLENGKIQESKMKSESTFKEKVNENLDIIKMTLPNVKEGSVLEITYRVASEFLFNFQDWHFQYTIPIVWSEYRANIPEFFNYDKYMQGYVGLTINDVKPVDSRITLTSSERSGTNVTQTTFSSEDIPFQENRYRWVAQNVPAFKSEPFMTTYKDYISKINFELSYIKYPNQPIKPIMGDWQQINNRYVESDNFVGEVTGNNFLKKMAEEVTTGATSDEQKIAALDRYVKSAVTWDGSSQKFTETSFKKVLETKKGTSAEINLLLASLLEKAGIKVSPVLLSTRDNGFLREAIPVSSQFNYAVCLAEFGDKQVLLDATDGLLPVGVLPERCLNGRGFVVSKEGFRWIDLKSSVKSRTVANGDFSVSEDGSLQGTLALNRTGYHAQSGRKSFLSKGEEDYVKDLTSKKAWQISKKEFKNTKEIHETFKENYELTISDHTTATGDILYLNPFILMREEENPFKSEKREYPVDFGSPLEKTYVIKLTIPQGYAVDETPQSKVFVMPNNDARYAYGVTKNGNQIVITSAFHINRSIFTQVEYPLLREFYNQVVAKQSEQIVLKKQ